MARTYTLSLRRSPKGHGCWWGWTVDSAAPWPGFRVTSPNRWVTNVRLIERPLPGRLEAVTPDEDVDPTSIYVVLFTDMPEMVADFSMKAETFVADMRADQVNSSGRIYGETSSADKRVLPLCSCCLPAIIRLRRGQWLTLGQLRNDGSDDIEHQYYAMNESSAEYPGENDLKFVARV